MISLSSILRIFKLTAVSALLILASITIIPHLSATGNNCMESIGGGFISVSHRKLVQGETTTRVATTAAAPVGSGTVAASKEETTRIWGDKCSRSDIVINQGATLPLPNGIPTYTVEIMNVCLSGCNISAIHLNCGWFSSARFVNPRIFKRLRYNDCLVNNGKPLINGRTISFQYANTFYYPLSVSSILC